MNSGIAEATRLTRAGKLTEATALIQQMLGSLPPPPVVSAAPPPIRKRYGGFSPQLRLQPTEPAAPRLTPISLPMPPASEPPAAGQFIDRTYTNRAGTRDYKVYIPRGYHGQALPVVVMLHGCTQSPDDFAAGTRMNAVAERELFFVVYPAQSASANRSKCWKWFSRSDQERESGEPSLIAGITSHVVREYRLDAGRVYVAGLSAGGAMAAIMGVAYPDIYAAIGVHSGLPYGAAHDLPSAFAAMKRAPATAAIPQHGRPTPDPHRPRSVPAIVFHGDADKTVHPGNCDEVLAQAAGLEGLSLITERGRVPGGKSYTRSVYTDPRGRAVMERWLIHGAGHGWSGGSSGGSHTIPAGPDASQAMVRFFLQHARDMA